MSADTEEAAMDLFGALLTPGDQKARMDSLLYGSEHEAAMRAAKRIGQIALAKSGAISERALWRSRKTCRAGMASRWRG